MKQSIRATNKPISARVTIPGSKSITNRALLLAAFADGISELFDVLISDDTLVFMEALRQLGISIRLDTAARSCIVAGGQGCFPNHKAAIWCGEAGTATRFLLAACAAMPGTYQFDASPRMRERPIAPLLRTLCLQGARVQPATAETLPLTLVGSEGLQGGDTQIDAVESSQFMSALLMVAPFAKHAVLLKCQRAIRLPYVMMTCTMMAEFGVLVRRLHQARFAVPVPQRYMARDYVVEPDVSTASYFFAAAALTGGDITVPAISRQHAKQGDIAFLTVLEKMGCEVIEAPDSLTVKGPPELKGVSVDMRHFSDTFMTLAALAPFASSPVTMTNIGHTRLQESDRISAMRHNLEALNVRVEEGDDWLKVYPSTPTAGVVDSHQDHRIAMACSLIGLRVPGIVIDNADCVAKTCPEFFSLFESLC